MSVTAGVEAGGFKAEATTTYSLETSLGRTWSSTQGKEQSVEFSCKSYDDGTEFKGGCMWQWQMSAANFQTGERFSWSAPLIKCTKDHK